jgi:tetrahydromethanopterin S-methyltransferase subunit G
VWDVADEETARALVDLVAELRSVSAKLDAVTQRLDRLNEEVFQMRVDISAE